MTEPEIEDFRIDICLRQADREQHARQKRADDVDPPSCIPIPSSMTFLPAGRIAMGARHVMRKTTFVNVDNRLARRLMRFDLLPKGNTRGFVRLRVCKCFF